MGTYQQPRIPLGITQIGGDGLLQQIKIEPGEA